MKIKLAIASLLAVTSISTSAQENKFKLTGEWMRVTSDVSSYELQRNLRLAAPEAELNGFDQERSGYNFYLGYTFYPKLSVLVGWMDSGDNELDYGANTLDSDAFIKATRTALPMSARGLWLGLAYTQPLTENLSVETSLGVWDWASDYDIQPSTDSHFDLNEDGKDWIGSIKLNYKVEENIELGAGFGLFNNNLDTDNPAFKVGLSYSF